MGGYTSVNRVGMLWRALRGSGSRQGAAVLPFPWTRSLWLTLPLEQLTQETHLPTGLPRGVHGPAAQGFDVGQSGTE